MPSNRIVRFPTQLCRPYTARCFDGRPAYVQEPVE